MGGGVEVGVGVSYKWEFMFFLAQCLLYGDNDEENL